MSADKVAFDANTGTLNIGQKFSGDLSGMYQCVVSNDYGTTMTPYLQIVRAGTDFICWSSKFHAQFLTLKIYIGMHVRVCVCVCAVCFRE